MSPAKRKPPGARVDNRPQRDRHLAVAEPAEAPEVPLPPAGTLAPTKKWWDEFWRSRHAAAMTPVHMPVLERLAECYDELRRTKKIVDKARIVQGSTGQPVANPLISYKMALQKEIRSLEAELGIGLKSASNLGITMGQEALTAQQLNAMAEEEVTGAGQEGTIDVASREEAALLEGFGEA